MRYPTYHCAMCATTEQRQGEIFYRGKLVRVPRRNADITEAYVDVVLNYAMEMIQNPTEGIRKGLDTPEVRMLHYQTLYNESLYFYSGFETLYVEPGVVEMIAGAKFDTDFEQSIKVTRGIGKAFSIAYPEGMYCSNTLLRPTLVTSHTPREYLARAAVDLRAMGLSAARSSLSVDTDDGTLQTLDTPLLCTLIRHAEGHLITRSGSQDTYEEIMQGSCDLTLCGTRDMTQEDNYICNLHLNMSQRVLSYLAAFPESLREGFPRSMAEGNSIAARIVATAKTRNARNISLPARFRNTPTPHFRHGHFRTLRDERFKRNVDGTPRVIYVNGMIVGKKNAKAETVESVSQQMEE